MDKFFETLESIIKRIYDLLAGVFKIFEKQPEEGTEEGTENEGNA